MAGWDDLDALQRVGVLQALYKVLGHDLSTKDPDSLRSRLDAEALGRYEADGTKSRDIKYNGIKCGTYSVTVKKASTRETFDLVDPDAFDAWMATDEALDYRDEFVNDMVEDFVRWVVDRTGEIPDGVEVRTVEVPEHASGTTIRIEPPKVARALGTALSPAIAGMLEGGA